MWFNHLTSVATQNDAQGICFYSMHECRVDHSLFSSDAHRQKTQDCIRLQEKFLFVTKIDLKQTLSNTYMFPWTMKLWIWTADYWFIVQVLVIGDITTFELEFSCYFLLRKRKNRKHSRNGVHVTSVFFNLFHTPEKF